MKPLRPLYVYTILVAAGFLLLAASIFGTEAFFASQPEASKATKQWVHDYGYIGIFAATLIAGTIIPLASPALVAYAAGFGLEPILLVITATAGNVIGVLINYYLARLLGMAYVEKKFSGDSFRSLVGWWNRWGILLLVGFGVIPFLPFDLLSLLCGLFKMKLHWFLLISVSTRLVQFGIFVFIGSLIGAGFPS